VDYRLEVLETAEIPTTELIVADVGRLILTLDRELED